MMVTAADSILVVLSGIVLGPLAWLSFSELRRHRGMAQRCRFFAVRDEVVWLVAKGYVSEQDQTFQWLYESVNLFSGIGDQLSLDFLMRTIKEARKSGYDPAAQDRVRELQEWAHAKDPAVTRAIDHFFEAITSIMMENSWQIKCLIALGKGVQSWAALCAPFAQLSRLISSSRYETYKEYDRARHAFAGSLAAI